MNIDWNQAPDWAHYHVFNRDERGYWHEYNPMRGGWYWQSLGGLTESFLHLPAGADWRQSLTERPKEKGEK